MPECWVREFTDPDECGAALLGGNVALTVTDRGIFHAKYVRIKFHKLWIQSVSSNLAWTFHVDTGERASHTVPILPGPPQLRNGVEVNANQISRLPPNSSYYEHAAGATALGGMGLPFDEMASYGLLVGRDPMPPKDIANITPVPDALARLQRLCAAAATLAEDAPAVIEHPQAARGLEQALISTMMDCLGGEVAEDRAVHRQHAAIMRRFHRFTEERIGEPLYLSEVCREIGASARTMNACCHEHLGIGAKHYLLLHRMHMARRALRRSARADTTVTEVAMRYGFWHLGRFAGEYKALFGESPFATLTRME